MSRYAGQYCRGQPFSNTGNRPHYIGPESQSEYVNDTYVQGYNTNHTNDQPASYENASQEVEVEYQTDYSADYNEYSSYRDYGYDQENSREGYSQQGSYTYYEAGSNEGRNDYLSKSVPDYHNYSSGNSNFASRGGTSTPRFSNRGSASAAGKFQRGKPYYQSQNQPRARGSANSFGRGRGRFNHNTGKDRHQPQKATSGQGQFGNMISSERGQFDTDGEKGQFNFLKKNNDANISTPVKNSNNENVGQFGLPTESVKQEILHEPSVGNNDSEQSEEKTDIPETEGNKDKENGSEEEENSDSSDEDTSFCKYCKLKFTTPKAFHTHTRGLQHTALVMEAKAKKGDARFQKEEVDAAVLEVHIPAPKPPEQVDAVEEFEDNWMNLEEDVIEYIKEYKNPENRDLNPNEVGKNPLPDDFNCPLCNVKCTGAGAFKMHIEGKQHRNNLEAAKQGAKIKKKKPAVSGVMVETKERPSKFAEMAADNESPMLGLEFVTEFQKSDIKAPPRYVCNLCESKCDNSTIIPHIVGLKHRLKFMQTKRPLMYDHLTKFNSKKKKSEMNANLEDFAREIEQEVGRGDVKIKVEIEDFEDENELKESMLRHSRALAEKVKELKEGNTSSFSHEPGVQVSAKPKEPPAKKARIAPTSDFAPEWKSKHHNAASSERREPHGKPWQDKNRGSPYHDPRRHPHDDTRRSTYDDPRRSSYDDSRRPPYDDSRRPPYDDSRRYPSDDPRRPPYDDPRRPPYDDRRRHPYDDNRRPPYDDPRRPPYNDPRRPPYDDPRRPPYDDPRRPPYDDPRRPPFDDPWDPYSRRRYPEDFRASYMDRFDPYCSDDPMYERRMFDERRRLDGLMGEGHRLDDPYAERRRVDDILERKRYLDQLETARLDDIMERKKRIQESDVDFLRLKRFTDRETPVASSSLSLNEEEMKRLDDQLARREALKTMESRDSRKTEMKAIQNKLALNRSSDPEIAARQDKAEKILREEAAKNPNVNIGEIMTNLSSSMIASEDDAAMALQVSNALTQALLKYRLQNAPSEFSSLVQSVGTVLEQKHAESSIPGLGTSTSSSSVPSFLRTSYQNSHSVDHSTSGSNTYSYASQQNTGEVFQPSTSTGTPYIQTSQQVTPSLLHSLSDSNNSFLHTSQQSLQLQYSYSENMQRAGTTVYSANSQRQQQTVTTAVPAAALSQVVTAGQNPKKSVIDTSNIDQPQKLLLESIRKQTELLRQKIQATSGAAQSDGNSSVVDVQSLSKHVPGLTVAVGTASPYDSYTVSSVDPAVTVTGHTSSSSNPPSSYSSQYYQYNYHASPPNSAPASVPPVHPPLPSEPALLQSLPTNDLPPLRRKKHFDMFPR